MFRVKVCGVTTPGDAAHAVACGADAVGINFHRGSPRHVDEAAAREILRAVGDRAEVVAVFVNEPPEAVSSLCAGSPACSSTETKRRRRQGASPCGA
jgi:phosphoribosylanthranilate isomerase